jgi:hypothetical protein
MTEHEKNVAEPDRSPMTICRLRISLWVLEATNTHSQYVKVTAFPLQEWVHERSSLASYTYIACVVTYCNIACVVTYCNIACVVTHCNISSLSKERELQLL